MEEVYIVVYGEDDDELITIGVYTSELNSINAILDLVKQAIESDNIDEHDLDQEVSNHINIYKMPLNHTYVTLGEEEIVGGEKIETKTFKDLKARQRELRLDNLLDK